MKWGRTLGGVEGEKQVANLGCPRKLLVRRCLFSEDLREVGGGAAGHERGSVRC